MEMEKSFWKNIGRATRYGLEKAKEIGSQLSDEAERRLDVRVAKDELERIYHQLGESIFQRVEEGKSIDPTDSELAELFTKIRQAQETLSQSEAELAAEKEKDKQEPTKS